VGWSDKAYSRFEGTKPTYIRKRLMIDALAYDSTNYRRSLE